MTDSTESTKGTAPVRWRCRVCGRDTFTQRYQAHHCLGSFRKRFRKVLRRKGLDGCPFEVAEHETRIVGY